jgi:hypothetical protein
MLQRRFNAHLLFALCYLSITSVAFPCSLHLVTHADKVVRKCLDGVGGGARLYGFRVVRDEYRLCGLDNHDTFSALCTHVR